jgi:hypothetical protein
MKYILLSLVAIGSIALTGCVVEEPYHHHHHDHVEVFYTAGRPYYYVGTVRYWGYPPGYTVGYGYRPSYHESYTRNVEVERNTTVVNNNRTVYVNRPATPAYHAQTYRAQGYRGPSPQVQTTTVKKKKKVETY